MRYLAYHYCAKKDKTFNGEFAIIPLKGRDRVYNGIQKLDQVIDYIESNITEDLDFDIILKTVNLSLYEFRRVFSFVVGCPLSEYVRKRRLSLAALEILQSEHPDLLKISEKYGYANQSSFSRAFGEYHGISPTACTGENVQINLFTRPKMEYWLSGRETVPFTLVQTEPFYIRGYTGISPITDTCCCDEVWTAFYESEAGTHIQGDVLYAAYRHQGDVVHCCIGEAGEDGLAIPRSRWVSVKLNTVDDDVVNAWYSKILYELLPSANLVRDQTIPTVEVFPADMSEDGFEWEIRIPIK